MFWPFIKRTVENILLSVLGRIGIIPGICQSLASTDSRQPQQQQHSHFVGDPLESSQTRQIIVQGCVADENQTHPKNDFADYKHMV